MKDKSLAVSKRDRQLLSVLLAFVLLFALYYFVAGPAFDSGNQLALDRQLAQDSLERVKVVMSQGPELQREMEAKKEEMSGKYQKFLYSINEARLLHQMDSLMTANGLVVTSYRQSGPTVDRVTMPVSGYTEPQYPLLDIAKALNNDLVKPETPGNNNSEESAEPLAVTVEQMDLGISFANVGYDVFYRFLKSIEDMERSFIVSDIILSRDPQVAGLQGQIVVRVISLPKVNETDAVDMEFQPIIPQGKTSPF